MALSPRRCPGLLLIQIPTSSWLGPFCVLLRSSVPSRVFRSCHSRGLVNSSRERAPHCLSLSLGKRACFSLSLSLSFSSSLLSSWRSLLISLESLSTMIPHASLAFPWITIVLGNTMDTMEGEINAPAMTMIDGRIDGWAHRAYRPPSERCLYFLTRAIGISCTRHGRWRGIRCFFDDFCARHSR